MRYTLVSGENGSRVSTDIESADAAGFDLSDKYFPVHRCGLVALTSDDMPSLTSDRPYEWFASCDRCDEMVVAYEPLISTNGEAA